MKQGIKKLLGIGVILLVTHAAGHIQAAQQEKSEVSALSLAEVRSWGYQIQGMDMSGAVEAIVNSKYDMVVIEPTVTYEYDFDAQDMVRRIKASAASDGVHRKLVIAYIDIGQAEEWRWYWDGHPTYEEQGKCKSSYVKKIQKRTPWVVACDPDGWGGNYPVAYWMPEWKDIVIYGTSLGPELYFMSMLDEVIQDGFDGVYLDWVEAWEMDAVQKRARREKKNPGQEMLQFIREIREYGRQHNPNFIVIQQNSSELIREVGAENLKTALDAIAQEELWWKGEATDDWDDPDGYDQPGDATDYYLPRLDEYKAAGFPVFICEYAVKHADAVYQKAQDEGFVAYVTRRSLGQLTTTPPDFSFYGHHKRGNDAMDKWGLWSTGTHLRGANIHQRRVYPELDGAEFMGSDPVGAPFSQEDFDRLAELGANYVNISYPGLFSERPPYAPDPEMVKHLDRLLEMIARADMFAVISFRTGPGRSEFTFFWEEVGDWFDESYLNDTVWQDQAAQDAWEEMWRYTAEYYRNHPVLVGYDLMVEPNANDLSFNPDSYDPQEFYAKHTNSLYDWNRLNSRITKAIREVDPETPILIGGMSYSSVDWLPYLKPTGDARTVYIVHQYAPFEYTHQEPPLKRTYPGEFDTDWDGRRDTFNRDWLEDLFLTIDTYMSKHNVPVAVNEFGVVRWEPGADRFMDDQIDLFEQRGINHALWVWEPAWEPLNEVENAFTFRFGPDPKHHKDVASSDLMEVIKKYWSRNKLRPSNVTFTATAK